MSTKIDIKLAIVVDELAIGNTTTFAINAAHALVKAGGAVTIICGRAYSVNRLPQINSSLSILPGIGGVAHYWSTYRARKALESFNPTAILYVHSTLYKRLRGFHKKHNTPALFALLNYIKKGDVASFIPRESKQLQNKILTVSESLRESLVNESKVQKERVTLITTGVDTNLFSFKKQVIGENRPVIGTVGHLIPSKGHSYFIQAAKAVLQEFPEALFIIAGKGPEKSHLKILVKELDIVESVIFVDETHSTIALLHTMDIYVVPSTEEGLGFAIVEAMSCGLPVVASNVGGIYSLVRDNQTGYLVSPRDTEALAEKISYLLKNPDICTEFRGAAREHIERHHSLTSFSDQLISTVKEVRVHE